MSGPISISYIQVSIERFPVQKKRLKCTTKQKKKKEEIVNLGYRKENLKSKQISHHFQREEERL